MNSELSLSEIQQAIFSMSAARSSDRFPLDIALEVANTNPLAMKDILELKGKGLISWDLSLKSQPFMDSVSNFDHMIECVVYYGNAEKGRCCIGFALGCVTEDKTAIELNFIEKRRDSGSELNSQFLLIIVDALSFYGLYLNNAGQANISKFVIVGPIEGIVPYYKTYGFEYVESYNSSGLDAMYRNLEAE
ncbi:hypothetical protein [Vibrio algicola]|uniref:N-acetyltransferase n=1 Tax=Vibrio algicola TaxID=2662262 RepID=A0A5Q0THF8_9VIBR|nr:hypothetical protein [Vibrio algicola]